MFLISRSLEAAFWALYWWVLLLTTEDQDNTHTLKERWSRKSSHLLSKINLKTNTTMMFLPSQLLEPTPSYSKCPPDQLRVKHFIITKYSFLPLHLKTGYVTFNNPLGNKTPSIFNNAGWIFLPLFACCDFSINTETKGSYQSQGQVIQGTVLPLEKHLPCMIRAVVLPKEVNADSSCTHCQDSNLL